MLDLSTLELKILKVGLHTLSNIFTGSSATRELQQKIDSELRAKGGSPEPCQECGGTGINSDHNEAHPCSCHSFSDDYLRIKPDRKNGRDN